MLLDSGKALWTDDMLDTACIGGCSFRINTQTDQPEGYIYLTESGQKIADMIYERHEFLSS